MTEARAEAAPLHTTRPEQSRTAFLLQAFLLPLLVGILLLCLEYGVFQPGGPTDASTLGDAGLRIAGMVLMAVGTTWAVLSLSQVLWVRLRANVHFREDFAREAFLLTAALTLICLTTIISGITPWLLLNFAVEITAGRPPVPHVTSWKDYGLLTLGFAMILSTLRSQHRSWVGLKSSGQLRREQQGTATGYLSEGVRELVRVLRAEGPLRSAHATDERTYGEYLDGVNERRSWSEQSMDLLRLSSSSYAFDSEKDWHDHAACWIGSNVHTGELVGLLPAQANVSAQEVSRFSAYAHRAATRREQELGELIVATPGSLSSSEIVASMPGVRFETEETLLSRLVDFRDYVNDIRKRVTTQHLTDSTLTLADVYVSPKFFPPASANVEPGLEQYLRNWLAEPTQRQLALLGEFGQGKSTAALMFAYHLVESPAFADRFPVVIELRGMSPRDLTPLQLLGAWASRYRIEPQALMRLLVAGRLVVIFEGFDEMALIGDAEMRLKHFQTLWQFCYPKAKILITGRPNFFLDEEEMKVALGIGKPRPGQPYCETLRLVPFGITEIKRALRRQKKSVRAQICQVAKDNPGFLELVSRPSLLHVVSTIWERERLYERPEELTSASVMEMFVRQSYRRQGAKAAEAPGGPVLTSAEREYFMCGIASYMGAKRLPNQIPEPQLNELVERLIAAYPETPPATRGEVIAGEHTAPLPRRLEGAEYGVEAVKTDVRACGLLAHDPAAPGTFRFGHKSFMEYLFASTLAESIIKEEAPVQAQVILLTTGARLRDLLDLPVPEVFFREILQLELRRLASINHRGAAASRDTLQDQFARRILRAISLPLWVLRLAAIGRSLPIAIILLTPILFISIPTFAEGDHLKNGFPDPYKIRLWLLCGIATSPVIVAFHPAFMGNLHIWNRLATVAGFENEVLHRVAGTSYLPWVRKRPFDLFLTATDRRVARAGSRAGRRITGGDR